MSFDRTDFKGASAVNAAKRATEMMPVARLIAGAAPVMSGLTQSEHWNRYLTLVQGFVERFTASRETARTMLSNPTVWKTEDLLKLKADVLVAQASIDAFEIAMQLPKLILEGGTAAEEFIAQHGVEHGTAENTQS